MEFRQIKESCLYVKDLPKTKDFYHHRLGLEIIDYQERKHIFFRVGTSVLLCFDPEDSRSKQSPPPHYAHGPQHLAFEVSYEDYHLWKEKIAQKGIKIIDTVVWGSGQESFYFLDPDGHVLEIVPVGVWEEGPAPVSGEPIIP